MIGRMKDISKVGRDTWLSASPPPPEQHATGHFIEKRSYNYTCGVVSLLAAARVLNIEEK